VERGSLPLVDPRAAGMHRILTRVALKPARVAEVARNCFELPLNAVLYFPMILCDSFFENIGKIAYLDTMRMTVRRKSYGFVSDWDSFGQGTCVQRFFSNLKGKIVVHIFSQVWDKSDFRRQYIIKENSKRQSVESNEDGGVSLRFLSEDVQLVGRLDLVVAISAEDIRTFAGLGALERLEKKIDDLENQLALLKRGSHPTGDSFAHDPQGSTGDNQRWVRPRSDLWTALFDIILWLLPGHWPKMDSRHPRIAVRTPKSRGKLT
jgi:hypothetical protein